MKEFFRGWRRKAGLVTLMMAFLLTGMWGRSIVKTDKFLLAGGGMGRGSQSLVSTREGLCWDHQLPVSYVGNLQGWWKTLECEEYFSTTNTIWRWRCAGFAYCEHHLFPTDDSICSDCYFIVPYWFLVLQPTLLSAYLIVWKPRKKG